jgi:WD40-like Beta Propeller Repeat
MKRLVLTVLTCLLGIVALSAKNTKRPLRVELAEQLRSSGYSLVDVYGGDAYIVSVDKRTLKAAKLKDPKKLASAECSSQGGRYFVLHKNGGIWLRDTQSQEVEQVEPEGQYSTQCFSPQGKFVYSSGKMVRVHDLAERKSTDIGEGGSFPSWSPDGKWLGFDDGKHYVLLNQTTGTRKKLFSTNDSAGPVWSPDSRYLTYTKSGGSTGGFLFWGIKCIEPYRVWVWRVEDDEHDWVQQICKPGRAFEWINNSELLPSARELP